MPAISITDTYNALLSSTFAMRAKILWDNLVDSVTLLKLIDAGNTKQTGSGHRIEFPLLYGSNSTVGRRGDYDTIDTTKQDGITIGALSWKNVSGTVTISTREEAMNSGKEQVGKLIDWKSQQLEVTMRNTVNSDLFSLGSTAQQIEGLQYWLRTATATVASIDDSTNTWWQNRSLTSVGSFASNGRDKMRNLYNTCSIRDNNDPPTDIFTTQLIHEALEKTIEPAERLDISRPTGTANIGAEKFKFRSAMVHWDDKCLSGAMYMLNLRDRKVQWWVLKDHDFDALPFVRPSDQAARTSIVQLVANLAMTVRRSMGVMTGVTA